MEEDYEPTHLESGVLKGINTEGNNLLFVEDSSVWFFPGKDKIRTLCVIC